MELDFTKSGFTPLDQTTDLLKPDQIRSLQQLNIRMLEELVGYLGSGNEGRQGVSEALDLSPQEVDGLYQRATSMLSAEMRQEFAFQQTQHYRSGARRKQ